MVWCVEEEEEEVNECGWNVTGGEGWYDTTCRYLLTYPPTVSTTSE